MKTRFSSLMVWFLGLGCADSGQGSWALPLGPVPDFMLIDLNSGSARAGEVISPRDYLEQVSGWYFAHST